MAKQIKKMFIHVPDSDDEDIEILRDNLQTFFDTNKLQYIVFVGRKFDTFKVNTEAFDKMRE